MPSYGTAWPRQATAPSGPTRTASTAGALSIARGAGRARAWLEEHRLYTVRSVLRDAGVWRFCGEGGAPFPPLDPVLRAKLQVVLMSEIERLEVMIGRDLSQWKGDRGAA